MSAVSRGPSPQARLGGSGSRSSAGRASAVRPARVPLSPRALQLLARADGELVAAQMCGQAWEQYLHAHLAALRAGAAVLAVRGEPAGRGAPRDVWGMLDRVAPELVGWSAYFAQGAGVRAAVEAGRLDAVSPERAAEALAVSEGLVDAVRSAVGLADPAGQAQAS